MLLGQVLEEVRREPDPMDLMADDFDLVTLARANAAAAQAGSSLFEVVRAAVDSFVAQASEEDWVLLVGRLQQGEAGPAACINLMLRRYLRELANNGSRG